MATVQLTPCLWFEDKAEEAARFYASVFPNSRILEITRYTSAGPRPEGSVMTVDFELDGQPMMALNGGPEFKFTPAVSFVVHCKDQQEVDFYWERLLDGGSPVQCGWLTDRFGLSWQIVPERLLELNADPDRARAARVMAAMMKMIKLEIAPLEAAARA
jgi:predicted 3-demethylubiquinone-9 3-methyltransferase (glyoxalase superfamily)